jgi:hypothetical protein
MPISVSCPCGARLKAPDNLAGKNIKCPKCAVVIKVGAAPVVAAAAKVGAAPAKPVALAEVDVKDKPPAAELPDDLRSEVEEELQTGERIVWIGQPVPRVVFWRNILYAVMGVVLLGLGGFAILLALGKAALLQDFGEHGLVFFAGAAGFTIAGVCLVLVPFSKSRRARRDVYLLTNKRAIVWTQEFFKRNKEPYLPSALVNLRSAGSWLGGGVGDVIFRTKVTIHVETSRRGPTTETRSETRFGFLAVERHKDVERMVRETLVDRFMDKLAQANDLD